MTVCNMSIEAGARAGLIAPDETTFDYVKGRPLAPKGEAWEQAVAYWRTLPSDRGRAFDKEVVLDAAEIAPQVTWGTSPEDVRADHRHRARSRRRRRRRQARARCERALDYMGLTPGTPLHRHQDRQGLHRLLHQRPHRGPARRRRRRQGPQGRRRRQARMVVPGSGLVKEQAEDEGLDRDLQRRRLRMARAGLLDVPGDERRPAGARRALRLDLATATSKAARAAAAAPTW